MKQPPPRVDPYGPYRKNVHARKLFDGIAGAYSAPARAFSFFQYDRWHRFLVSRLSPSAGAGVLDVCTGTALVATRIADELSCDVVGVDLSRRMVERVRGNARGRGLTASVRIIRGRAETLPFADASFDAVVFTFLLRYVEEPEAVLRELTRVLRPGGQMVSLEFFVPRRPLLRAMWLLHTRLVMPTVARFLSNGWREVGSFLGPSISDFYREHSLESLAGMWSRAGVKNVEHKVLSLGGAVVTWGRKES